MTWIFFPETLNTVKDVSTTAWAHHPSTTASNLQCLPLTLGQCGLPRTRCTSTWACSIWNYSGHVVNRILNQHVIQLMQETEGQIHFQSSVHFLSDVKISCCFGHYIDATGVPHIQFKTLCLLSPQEKDLKTQLINYGDRPLFGIQINMLNVFHLTLISKPPSRSTAKFTNTPSNFMLSVGTNPLTGGFWESQDCAVLLQQWDQELRAGARRVSRDWLQYRTPTWSVSNVNAYRCSSGLVDWMLPVGQALDEHFCFSWWLDAAVLS